MGVLGSMRDKVREGRQLTGVPKHQEEGEHRGEPPRRRPHAREVSHWAAGYLSLPLVSRNWRRRVVLRAIRRCGALLREIAPRSAPGRPANGTGAGTISRSQAASEAGLSDDQRRTPLPWIDVPVRALTADELRDDPRQARVVRRRWLQRQPERGHGCPQGDDHYGANGRDPRAGGPPVRRRHQALEPATAVQCLQVASRPPAMSAPDSPSQVSAESARALLGGSGIGCPACGKPLEGRQTACSGKCRAALSRRRREEAQRTRDEEVRVLLETALKKLNEGAP